MGIRITNPVKFSILILIFTIFAVGTLFANPSKEKAGAAAGGKVAITVWGPTENASQTLKDSFKFVVEEYRRRYPDVEVTSEVLAAGTDYRQRYDQALMAGEAPTITNILPPVDVQTRAKNGTIREITPLILNWDLKKQGVLNTSFDPALELNGKWYAVMDRLYLAGTPYHKTNLRAGGGNPEKLPKTWSEFIDVCVKVTDPRAPRYGYLLLGMEWNAWPFTVWVWSAGGDMVRPNPDGTYKITFNEEPGVDVAEFWNSLIWKHGVTQKDVLKSWNDLRDDMHAGRGVFAFSSIENYTADAEKKYGVPIETFGIMPMPAKDGPNGKLAGLCGGNVWTFSPHATEAQVKAGWDFVQLASYDKEFLPKVWAYENTLTGIDSQVPARVDMVDIKYGQFGTKWPKGWAEEFAALSRVVTLEPFCANWNDLKNVIAPYLQQILLKQGITRDEIRTLLNKAADETYAAYPASFKR
jgi:ABC-type glycerol-3-phosphate transport system substrate-binding protein